MAEFDQLAGPVMRGAARLDADQAGGQPGKEWQHLRSPKRLTDDNLTGRINTVNLKNTLGQVEADRGNLHDGWLPFARERLMAFTPWHLDAVSGSHPPHLFSVISGSRGLAAGCLLPPEGGHWTDIRGGPFSATSGLVRCSRMNCYSMTSSARPA